MPPQILQSYPLLSGLPGSSFLSQSILDIFVLQDIIDYEDAEKLKEHFKTNREIENFLVKNRLVTKDTINKAYSILLKIPYIGLKSIEIPDEAKKLISRQIAHKYGIIPFNVEGKLMRLAISRPADLLAGFAKGLISLLEQKNLALELFITGDSDFRESVSQYDKKKDQKLLIKKGSLPVIYLRNLKIPSEYLTKIPKQFVDKYRVLVFAENMYGGYMVACQEPDSFVTKKVLDYIKRENKIKLEVFAAAKDDFDHILKYYDNYLKGIPVKTEEKKPKKVEEEKPAEKKNENISFSLESLFGSKEKKEQPQIVIDSVSSSEAQEFEEVYKTQDAFEEKKKPNKTVDSEKKNGSEEEKAEPLDVIRLKETIKPEGEEKEAEKSEKSTSEPEGKKREDEQSEKEKKEASNISVSGCSDDSKKTKTNSSISFGGDSLEAKDLGSLLQEDVTNEKQLQSIINEGYVPKIVAAVINYSLNKKVSDVHVEPQNKSLRVRCRIDGVLIDIAKMPLALHPPIISRIKILSKLKIDETRVPQDGRFEVSFQLKDVDVRVSSLPTVHGEKMVLRILDKNQKILSLEDLGMHGSAFEKTLAAIQKPWGILLSTGPTGSGKSTTLNAIIARLNKPGINIVTLEDPVEYETAGVNQCQIRPDIGFTFAAGLRSILRQDPNIIMVGEIRDGETAGMATHAALTGHLVLSTLHTNDTAGALPRLINMGVEPFLITSSIDLIAAQRLVRLICPKCREEMKVPANLLDEIKKELEAIPKNNIKEQGRIPAELKFYYGRGCSECTQGYRGRIGLFEVMEMTPEVENLAIGRKAANEIKESAIKSGMITMKQDGILKALAGHTTLDEVFQATVDN